LRWGGGSKVDFSGSSWELGGNRERRGGNRGPPSHWKKMIAKGGGRPENVAAFTNQGQKITVHRCRTNKKKKRENSITMCSRWGSRETIGEKKGEHARKPGKDGTARNQVNRALKTGRGEEGTTRVEDGCLAGTETGISGRTRGEQDRDGGKGLKSM